MSCYGYHQDRNISQFIEAIGQFYPLETKLGSMAIIQDSFKWSCYALVHTWFFLLAVVERFFSCYSILEGLILHKDKCQNCLWKRCLSCFGNYAQKVTSHHVTLGNTPMCESGDLPCSTRVQGIDCLTSEHIQLCHVQLWSPSFISELEWGIVFMLTEACYSMNYTC